MIISQSLPVAFGFETAKWICVGAIDVTQLSVAGMLSKYVNYIATLVTKKEAFVFDFYILVGAWAVRNGSNRCPRSWNASHQF